MVIPCIDLMGGKVVQLIQGEKKALELDELQPVLDRFAPFREIQVVDLDAAMEQGANQQLIRTIASQKAARVGGGVRTIAKAKELVQLGARKVIVGTAAFAQSHPNHHFLEALAQAIGRERIIIALDTKGGRIVVRGWRQPVCLTAEEVIPQLEPYCAGFLCTYVDKEGMMEGTNLEWFRCLRQLTDHEITAAGGISSIEEIEALAELRVHAALGMALYTGKLPIEQLLRFQD